MNRSTTRSAAVTGTRAGAVGGVIGGVMVELLSLGPDSRPARRSFVGNQNISLSVTDLDDTYRRVQAAGYQPDQAPFEIADVRMFFVKDPDGTAVEFIEFPRHRKNIGGAAPWRPALRQPIGIRTP